MDAHAPAVFLRSFAAGLPDPRRHNVRHRFTDILAIAVLAVMCRADDWDEVVVYARANRAWLATFLALPNGILSVDTFARLFVRLDPAAFERAFVEWTASLATASDGRLVAIDGKAMRHSFAHGWDKQMVHLVSAWCQRNDLALGQLAVDEKGNEITAVPKLLALKDNQPTLHARARRVMDEVALDQAKGVGGASSSSSFDYHERTESGARARRDAPGVGHRRRGVLGPGGACGRRVLVQLHHPCPDLQQRRLLRGPRRRRRVGTPQSTRWRRTVSAPRPTHPGRTSCRRRVRIT